MTVPANAIKLPNSMDPQEVIDFEFPMSPVLETGEEIDASHWSITLLSEAVSDGFEIITGDSVYPDPTLLDEDTTISAWFRVDQSFAGTFDGGASMPLVVTLMTTNVPPRKRQRTFIISVEEQ